MQYLCVVSYIVYWSWIKYIHTIIHIVEKVAPLPHLHFILFCSLICFLQIRHGYKLICIEWTSLNIISTINISLTRYPILSLQLLIIKYNQRVLDRYIQHHFVASWEMRSIKLIWFPSSVMYPENMNPFLWIWSTFL